MKFTIVNNQPVKRVLPMIGSLVIEPYGTLIVDKPEGFKKSLEGLSKYGYSIYYKEKEIPEESFLKSSIDSLSTTESIEDSKKVIPLTTKQEEKKIVVEKPVEEINSVEEIKEMPKETISIDSKEEIKEEEIKEEEGILLSEVQEKETREVILNKCKSLSADNLRAILKEIGINSTSNNTNTLFNKLSNSEVNDELLISAYHKVVE